MNIRSGSSPGPGHRGWRLAAVLLAGICGTCLGDSCRELDIQVGHAYEAGDTAALERYVAEMDGGGHGCPAGYRDQVRGVLTSLLFGQAMDLLRQGRPLQAQRTMDRAPDAMHWMALLMKGEVAGARKSWGVAAKAYGLAYEMAGDGTQQPPADRETQLRIFDLAAEAQILADSLDATLSRSGEPSGILASRGPKPKYTPLPVRFEYDSAELSDSGRQAAERLAAYLVREGGKGRVRGIELVGHTDPRGDAGYNQRLSERRAQEVKRFLQQQGVRLSIACRGEGEDSPPRVSDPARYSREELYAIHRRVELRILN